MRKTITFVFLAVFTLIISVHAFAKAAGDSILLKRELSKNLSQAQDTLLISPVLENPLLSYQNLVYKRRLDSVQNTVALSYNEHVQNYIDIYISRKEQIGKMLGLSEYYFPIFERALKETGIPDELKFITVVESALNPNAISRSGAVGPWQFMYGTAKGYGLIMDSFTDERKDPVKASYAAAHYLLDAYKNIGDWLLTIAAFNCGTGAVTRAIQRSGGIADFWKVRPFLPLQTQNYVPAFIATVYAMKYYKNHEISVRPASFNTITDVIPVNRRISIASVAMAADLDLKELLILNPSFKKQIINGSALEPKPLVIPTVNNTVYASLYNLFNGMPDDSIPVPLQTGLKEPEGSKTVLKEVQKVLSGKSIPSSKPAAAKKETTYIHYIVKAGDTLSEIAEKFQGLTVSKLKALNGLTKTAIIPGMRLKIVKDNS